PHEITKIVRKANESLTVFKERWTVETGFIMGVPEVMKISSFMDAVKSPELAKRFSNKVLTTVNEMMERLDDFVRSEEAYARTKLLKGEVGDTHCKTSLVFNRRDNRSSRNTHPRESRRNEYQNNYRSGRDAYLANRTRDDRAPYPPPRGEYNHIKAVRDGVRVGKIESLDEGCTTEGKGIPWQGGFPTSKGDQCDQCKFGKGLKAEREGNDGAVDEHPNILSNNILGLSKEKWKDTWSEGYTWMKGHPLE
ncbi:hypothetical protein Tco_0034616, partial [Tanacetum coccineum]